MINLKKILLLTLIIILIPLLIVGLTNSTNLLYKIKYGSINNKVIKVKRNESNLVESIPIEKYVVGVVASEMPASFNEEALKAQAVASRTYALNKAQNSKNDYDVDDGTSSQVYIDEDQMKEKWQDNYEENLKKIKKAVTDTKGEVILYNNNIIDAMFFSTSNGYTENSDDVFKNSMPYLKSVESKWDKEESPVFSSTKEVSKDEFLFNLNLPNSTNINIENIEKTNTGRVKNITINGTTFESSKIRNAFGLKSTSFNIEVKDDTVIFNVNGYGHGVGMSQYGANGMAKEGYNYKDILNHYYQDCEIKKIS